MWFSIYLFLSDVLIFQELLFTGEVFKVENTGKTKSSHTKVPAFTVEYCYTYAVLNYKFYLLWDKKILYFAVTISFSFALGKLNWQPEKKKRDLKAYLIQMILCLPHGLFSLLYIICSFNVYSSIQAIIPEWKVISSLGRDAILHTFQLFSCLSWHARNTRKCILMSHGYLQLGWVVETF